MNWDAIGAVGEVIGAVAVVVSILYLALQINSNTKATRAAASFDATHSWAELNETLATQWSSEERRLLRKSFEPTTQWDDISEDDRTGLILMMRSGFQKLEGQYFLYQYGLLKKKQWEPRAFWAKGVVQLPFYRTFWENEIDQFVYSHEFVEAINNQAGIEISTRSFGGSPNSP